MSESQDAEVVGEEWIEFAIKEKSGIAAVMKRAWVCSRSRKALRVWRV